MVSFFDCLQPHFSVEHIAPREIEDSESELFSWVVLYVDSMVKVVLILAYSHIGLGTSVVYMPG